MQTSEEQILIEKLRTLSPEKIAEVEHFVDFLRQRNEDRVLTQAAMRLSEPAFDRTWNNAEDEVYDRL